MDFITFCFPLLENILKLKDDQLIIDKINNIFKTNDKCWGDKVELNNIEDCEIFILTCILMDNKEIELQYLLEHIKNKNIVNAIISIQLARTIFNMDKLELICWLKSLLHNGIDSNDIKLILIMQKIKLLDSSFDIKSLIL